MRGFNGDIKAADSKLFKYFHHSDFREILLPKLAEAQSRISPNEVPVITKKRKNRYKISYDDSGNEIKTLKSSKILEKQSIHLKQGDTLESIVFKRRREEDLLFWVCAIHYIEHPMIFEVRVSLEKLLEKSPEFQWMLVLLDSKEIFLIWFIENDIYHSREFFGNVLDDESRRRRIKSLHFQYADKKKPKRRVHHRGYRDKGTLPSLDSKIRKEELAKDAWNTEEQLDIESDRESVSDLLDLIKGYYS